MSDKPGKKKIGLVTEISKLRCGDFDEEDY